MAETSRAAFIRKASRFLPGHRRPPPPPNPLNNTGRGTMPSADQSQAAFFRKLPAEIRTLIYLEVMKGEGDVVHIVKKGKRKLDYVRCKGTCAMAFNFRCSPGIGDVGDELLLPMLRTCQKAYICLVRRQSACG